MHVYLKKGDQQRWLIVHLVEGHIPKISDLSNDDTRSITENLEPAIWFKVMVLESITVDCTKRVVCWTNGIKDEGGVPVTNVLYGADQSCYDFDDDIDELFKLGTYLIEMNPLSELNEERRRDQVMEYERSVIRMLHCYILGKVILQPRDIDCVGSAFTSQLKSIAQLEDNALVHSRLAEHYLAQMRNIRELEIFPVFEQLVEDKLVDEDFLKIILVDIKKIEPILRHEVDIAQSKVDELKTRIANGKLTSLACELESARYERDETHKNLQQHLICKELTKMVLSNHRYTFANDIEMNENCCRYVKIHTRVMSEKSISRLTIDKKLRAASVRECIESVIKELEKGHESTGDEETVDGQRVTDVIIRENCAAEWQTLTQRLSSIIHNKEHPVGLAFHNFCSKMENHYRKILRSVENFKNNADSFASNYSDFYVVSEKDLGLNKMYIENQRNYISTHIYQITELLAETFQNNWNMFVRKIRLCYEKCFYHRLGRDLILIYRMVYSKSLQTIKERITKLKEIKICKLGLEMKSEWWLQLFEMEDNGTTDENNYDIMNNINSFDDESNNSSDSENEVSDNDEFTDLDEDEYNDPKRSGTLYGYTEKMRIIKAGLQSSTDKVLSRSCFDVSDLNNNGHTDLVKMNSQMLEEEITERANKERPRFDSDAMTRFLEYEGTLELVPSNMVANGRRSSVASMRFVKYKAKVQQNTLPSPQDTFDLHFGAAIKKIKNVFINHSPLKKMQCLTAALRLITSKVEELRMRGRDEALVDRAEVAVTAEDLLPLLVLVLLKLAPHDAAKLYVELLFVSDLMADFLSSGCHSYALCEFQIGFRVLDQTCDELSI